jgi:hypothetical protein
VRALMRSFLVSVLIFLLGAASGAGLAWLKTGPNSSELRRLRQLLALREDESDRLRSLVSGQERARNLEKSKGQREAIEKQVTEIRGLTFEHPVDYQALTRKQIKDVVAGKLADAYSEADFANMSAALARLGLLPAGYPLRQKYIDLLGEQIAAFYDQHQHKLFMFEDATLDNAQNCVVLAHELTHALQDQHFNLLHMPLELKNDDDRAEAASALVEGEATIVMSDYMMRNMSLRALKDNVATSLTQNMDQLQQAPRYLRETLVFPYLRGQEFCNALLERGGYDAISRAFAHPPSSTSQILHPEKYLSDPPEEPVAITWPDVALDGRQPSDDNVLGEFGIRILLNETGDAQTAERTAAGWRGDRYLLFGNGDALVWKSQWATVQDAARFFEAEKQGLEKRYHPAQPRATDSEYTADAPRALRLAQAANFVLLLDAPSAEMAGQMQARFAWPQKDGKTATAASP